MQTLLKKKGQLKIQEMAFVLVAVIFLGGLLLLLFARFQSAQLAEQARMLREFRTATLLRVVAGLPELQCRLQGIKDGPVVCTDRAKLLAFDENPTLRKKYEELWKHSHIAAITIKEVYPPGREYLIYNRTLDEDIVVSATYIPLCDEKETHAVCVVAQIKIATIMP